MERNHPHFGTKKNFGETDSRGDVGWVLIAMDVILICDIGWNKSDIRNMKNQNFRISGFGRVQNGTSPHANSTRKRLPYEKKLGSRMDGLIFDRFCVFFNVFSNVRFQTSEDQNQTSGIRNQNSETSAWDAMRPPSPPYNAERTGQPRASMGLRAINSPYIVI